MTEALLFLSAISAILILAYKKERSMTWVAILVLYATMQLFIASQGFYLNTFSFPPRFLVLILPAFITVFWVSFFKSTQSLRAEFNESSLYLVHVVRIPVEWMLYELYQEGLVPLGMTFEGSNPDILSGITALLIWYFGIYKKQLPIWVLKGWNILALGLLFNIVIRAILSAPTPLQQLAFNQPNLAVFRFPFVLLPGLIVPLVMLSHLLALKRLFTTES